MSSVHNSMWGSLCRDGTTSGSNFCHTVGTNGETSPWWQLKMAGGGMWTKVKIFNRNDVCASRMFYGTGCVGTQVGGTYSSSYQGAVVSVSDSPCNGDECPNGQVCAIIRTYSGGGNYKHLGGNVFEVTCPPGYGEYLRIQLPGPNRMLNFHEVQVWGESYDQYVSLQGRPMDVSLCGESQRLPAVSEVWAQRHCQSQNCGSYYYNVVGKQVTLCTGDIFTGHAGLDPAYETFRTGKPDTYSGTNHAFLTKFGKFTCPEAELSEESGPYSSLSKVKQRCDELGDLCLSFAYDYNTDIGFFCSQNYFGSADASITGWTVGDPQRYQSCVTTVGGNVATDSQCVFPFTYRGVEYSECTTVDNDGVAWCSTDATFDGNWGECCNDILDGAAQMNLSDGPTTEWVTGRDGDTIYYGKGTDYWKSVPGDRGGFHYHDGPPPFLTGLHDMEHSVDGGAGVFTVHDDKFVFEEVATGVTRTFPFICTCNA